MGGTLRRIAWIVFVVLVVGCCCSGTFALVTTRLRDPDASVDVMEHPWVAGFGGLLLIFVLGWITFRLARFYIRDWRLRLFGEEVKAVILTKNSYLDRDNDLVWEYTVAVTPPLGPSFTRSYGPHMGGSEPVGTKIPARYYRPTGGLSIGPRTFGSFVLTSIVDLTCIALLAMLLYSIGRLSWAMISLLLN